MLTQPGDQQRTQPETSRRSAVRQRIPYRDSPRSQSRVCHAEAVKITDEVERGAWLVDRMHGGSNVGAIAGYGFEAYVRLLHPRPSDHPSRQGWGVPPDDDWSTRRWADVAADRGHVMHPLVQWWRLHNVDEPFHDASSSIGWLDPLVLAALVPLLRAGTTTADDVVAGFWEGGSGQKLVAARTLTLNDGLSYVLATTTLDELTDADWGYSLQLGWPGVSMWDYSMQVLWPEDHAWVLTSDIDFDSTIVAGSRDLVAAILTDGRFEAFEVGPDDDLSWEGDVINGHDPA